MKGEESGLQSRLMSHGFAVAECWSAIQCFDCNDQLSRTFCKTYATSLAVNLNLDLAPHFHCQYVAGGSCIEQAAQLGKLRHTSAKDLPLFSAACMSSSLPSAA